MSGGRPPRDRIDQPRAGAIDQVAAALAADIDTLSVKRIAWLFGCARKDSEDERQLYKLLVRKLDRLRAARIEGEAA